MREQITSKAPPMTRRLKASGDLGGLTLGELQSVKKRFAKRICKKHIWRKSKWSRQCSICGLVEDKDKASSTW